MCLRTKLSIKDKKAFLADKSEWIKVYKEIDSFLEDKWKAAFISYFYYDSGLNICPKPKSKISCGNAATQYTPYYHFYANRPKHIWNHRLITCYVKKSWISTIGKEGVSLSTVVVARKAIFPTYPHHYLTKEEKKEYGIIKCA